MLLVVLERVARKDFPGDQVLWHLLETLGIVQILVAERLGRFNEGQDTYAELVEGAQTLSEEDLNDPHRFQEMPENWIPWKVFASNSFEHYQEHMPALRRWVTQG